MKYKCIKSFSVDKFENEDDSFEPIGEFTVEIGSIWEEIRLSGNYEIMLDSVEDGEWLGLCKDTLKKYFVGLEEENDGKIY